MKNKISSQDVIYLCVLNHNLFYLLDSEYIAYIHIYIYIKQIFVCFGAQNRTLRMYMSSNIRRDNA